MFVSAHSHLIYQDLGLRRKCQHLHRKLHLFVDLWQKRLATNSVGNHAAPIQKKEATVHAATKLLSKAQQLARAMTGQVLMVV